MNRIPSRSTPARLYQERSNRHDLTGRWAGAGYHCPASAWRGFLSATMRAPRGLRCSMVRLIVPLPAASRPSNRIEMRSPVSRTQFLQLQQFDLQLELEGSWSARQAWCTVRVDVLRKSSRRACLSSLLVAVNTCPAGSFPRYPESLRFGILATFSSRSPVTSPNEHFWAGGLSGLTGIKRRQIQT